MAKDEKPRINAAKELLAVHEGGLQLVGDPVADWKSARRVLQQISALGELFREVRLVRLFRATDALASGLRNKWLATGTYEGVSGLVSVLEQEKLVAVERDPRGCILADIHKSKGKEFDGVVLDRGIFFVSFLR